MDWLRDRSRDRPFLTEDVLKLLADESGARRLYEAERRALQSCVESSIMLKESCSGLPMRRVRAD